MNNLNTTPVAWHLAHTRCPHEAALPPELREPRNKAKVGTTNPQHLWQTFWKTFFFADYANVDELQWCVVRWWMRTSLTRSGKQSLSLPATARNKDKTTVQPCTAKDMTRFNTAVCCAVLKKAKRRPSTTLARYRRKKKKVFSVAFKDKRQIAIRLFSKQ